MKELDYGNCGIARLHRSALHPVLSPFGLGTWKEAYVCRGVITTTPQLSEAENNRAQHGS